jgi:hypothetical protein
VNSEDQAFLARTGEEEGIQFETKVLDFVERWIKFALPQINILAVLWFDSKIYIANLSVAGETWEKLPEEDTSFDK